MSRLPKNKSSEGVFSKVERAHVEGMTVREVLDALADVGEKLTEATFRKYVQLGLLPRSVRVGSKGKHRGSRGLYPATVVRQIAYLRRLMSEGFTLDEIQKEFLFVRGDIDALSRQIGRVFDALDASSSVRSGDRETALAVTEARELAASLIKKLESVEHRLSVRARMTRAAV